MATRQWWSSKRPLLKDRASIWAVRIAFALVFTWNVMCAVQFICWPLLFVDAYQLQGAGGMAAVQGLGVAFLMWNATYPAFVWDPVRFRSLGIVVLVQQVIGLIGELYIASTLGAGQELLSQGIARFVGFDALGLVLMGAAFYFFNRSCKAASA